MNLDKLYLEIRVPQETMDVLNQALEQLTAAFITTADTFWHTAASMFGIAPAIKDLSKFWNMRMQGEHPADWVLRVGAEVSGYNITQGERWRFQELRDWWTPDDVADEYGRYAPGVRDLWE